MNEQKIIYLDYKKKFLDEISPTFCLAKWYEVTMWLYVKSTASCHHNPFHDIELTEDPSDLHNTKQKIVEREQMLRGERVDGCKYCWDAEDSGSISDRMRKSSGFKGIVHPNKDIPIKVNPKKIEIAFSRTCQLACAYCGPSFSSSWANDINANGSYELITNISFNKDIKDKIIKDEQNVYIEEFFNWWPTLKKDLLVLRFTGGEPLLSIKFWEFLDLLDIERDYKGTLIVNSNLIHSKGQVQRFIEKTRFMTKNRQKVEIHTSCESSLKHAEYTRDGFDGEIWWKNLIEILENSDIRITVTTAINNMSVWSFDEYLSMIIRLKNIYGKDRVTSNFNRVLNPLFHQIALIPIELRQELSTHIEKTFSNLIDPEDTFFMIDFTDFIDYLKKSKFNSEFDTKHVLKDMIRFYEEFNKRRNKDTSLLDHRYLKWINDTKEYLSKIHL
jgi:organic radical activating enzyme